MGCFPYDVVALSGGGKMKATAIPAIAIIKTITTQLYGLAISAKFKNDFMASPLRCYRRQRGAIGPACKTFDASGDKPDKGIADYGHKNDRDPIG